MALRQEEELAHVTETQKKSPLNRLRRLGAEVRKAASGAIEGYETFGLSPVLLVFSIGIVFSINIVFSGVKAPS